MHAPAASASTYRMAMRWALGLGLLGLLIGTVGIRTAGSPAEIRFFDNLHWTSTTSASAVVALLAALQARGTEQAFTLRWAAAGMMAYALGQWVWDWQVWQAYQPFPAPADALYLLLGPGLTLAFLRPLWRVEQRWQRVGALLDVASGFIALTTLVLVLYLPNRGETDGWALATLVAYPTLLLAALSALLVLIPTQQLRPGWGLLSVLAGVAGTAACWMVWNFQALDGQTTDGSWFNPTFSVANLLLGWGLSQWTRVQRGGQRWARLCDGFLRLLPLAVVLLAAAAIVVANGMPGLPEVVMQTTNSGAGVIVILAVLRQAMLLRERDELQAVRAALERSQQTLADEKLRLTTVLATIPDLVWLKDPQGVYLGCNPAFERLFGVGQEQLVGRTDFDFVAPEKAQFFRQYDLAALSAGHACRNEESLEFAADGYRGDFETIKTPMVDAQGRVIGVLGVARDITQRKAAERQLQLHSGILAHLVEGIHLVRADDLIIIYANSQLEQLFGYHPGELIGQHVSVLNASQPEQARLAAEAILQDLRAHGKWEGDMRNRRRDGSAFWSRAVVSGFHHPELGPVWISAHTDATQRKQAEDEVRALAFYDVLTRLPNRRLMQDRAAHAIASAARSGRSGAMMLIDLDNFKSLNDTQGHDVGDQLLISVADRLSASLREGDTVSRLGGDEFVVILDNLEPATEGVIAADAVARKLLAVLGQPHRLQARGAPGTGNEFLHQCTPSIGVCMFDEDRLGVDELLKRADTAMYQAKRAGRNAVVFFDPEMQRALARRAQLEEELREAIATDAFELHYQPQVDVRGALTGVEALVRWRHPERGLVPPGQFIGLAEETGLIVDMGHLVLVHAMRQARRWKDIPALCTLTVSVNVSARQIHQSQFVGNVLALLAQSEVPAQRIKIEITEGTLLSHTEDVIAKLVQLDAAGISFSMDDFGTGYSSLSYLKRLPLSQLKIDQSFVRDLLTDPNDAAIAKTVIDLGRSLDLYVIAEGVETEEQRAVLRDLRCDAFQGYLFGKPMPAADFEQWALAWVARQSP